MNQNPLEQQQIRINTIREQTRASLGRLFDNRDELDEKIELFISQLDAFERSGLVFNREEIIEQIRATKNIKEREAFISHLLKVLEPIIIAKATRSDVFDKVEREMTMSAPGNIKLSEVLYVNQEDINSNSEGVYIHLTTARDFMTRERKEDFKIEIEKGLVKLAEMIKPYPNLKKIWASSWIVAIKSSARRLQEMGFSAPEEVSEGEREEYFPDEKRPVAKTFIMREDFLARYNRSETSK